MKKWYRSETNVKLAGICGGMSEMFDIDVTIIRFMFLVLMFTPSPIIFAYLVAWFIVPKKGDVYATHADNNYGTSASSTTKSSPSDPTSKKEFLIG